jgi:O-antigen chain-terminating methyltransferase
MIDGFYRAFEDKHRGSLETIKERQRAYLPLITPLLIQYPNAATLDLGCGRGEWLELLEETGFQASGVDLDEGMLAECRRRGLDVQTQDALDALKNIPDNSVAIVSGFHFAEHIPFDVLQRVVQEALRVLLPAGLLILETPNPENILVGTSNFYLDPTHQRPLPPLLMEFLPEYYGFHRTKVLRLQEPAGIDENEFYSLYDVFGGVSPDYAIVAQKTATSAVLSAVSYAFERDIGVTLGAASSRYDAKVRYSFNESRNEIGSARNEIGSARDEYRHLFNVAKDEAFQALRDLDQRFDHRTRLIEAHQQRIQDHLSLIEARRPISRLKRLVKKIVLPGFKIIKALLNRYPRLRAWLIYVCERFGIYGLLSKVLRKGVVAAQTSGYAKDAVPVFVAEEKLVDQSQAVQRVFKELDAAINAKK